MLWLSRYEKFRKHVPIVVLTYKAPEHHPKENDRLTFSFVTDGIESSVAQAKAAAGNKDATIIGAASTAQQCLEAGLADELHIDIMPVLLFDGLRLFDNIDLESTQLEKLKFMNSRVGQCIWNSESSNKIGLKRLRIYFCLQMLFPSLKKLLEMAQQ